MNAQPLILVRATRVWERETDFRTSRVVVEPLIIRAIGSEWVATGERSADKRLQYRQVVCRKREVCHEPE